MKTNIIQDTQRILDLIAKRDLDDDGKILFKSNNKFYLSVFLYRKEAINR
jgi:hypothetical protein